jgi:hypothetical protein
MEINATYLDRFKPTERKAGDPRSDREAALLPFRSRLNADRAKAGYPALSSAYLATMFKDYPTDRLSQLFKECDAAEKFGGLLKFKLADFKKV